MLHSPWYMFKIFHNKKSKRKTRRAGGGGGGKTLYCASIAGSNEKPFWLFSFQLTLTVTLKSGLP